MSREFLTNREIDGLLHALGLNPEEPSRGDTRKIKIHDFSIPPVFSTKDSAVVLNLVERTGAALAEKWSEKYKSPISYARESSECINRNQVFKFLEESFEKKNLASAIPFFFCEAETSERQKVFLYMDFSSDISDLSEKSDSKEIFQSVCEDFLAVLSGTQDGLISFDSFKTEKSIFQTSLNPFLYSNYKEDAVVNPEPINEFEMDFNYLGQKDMNYIVSMLFAKNKCKKNKKELRRFVAVFPYDFVKSVSEKKCESGKLTENLCPQHFKSSFSLLDSIPVEFSVSVGQTRRYLKDILNMEIGTIMELDSQLSGVVTVYAYGHPIAEAELIVIGYNFHIRITKMLVDKEEFSVPVTEMT